MTLPRILLAAGVLLSVLAAHLVRLDAIDDHAQRFIHAADQIRLKIRERLESHELILRGGAALFAASGTVSRGSWKTYVNTAHPDDIVPGVQGIGYAEAIAPQALAAHIARIRGEGYAAYSVKPAGDRPLYSAIIYLEPFSDRNLRAFGYDMFSEPVRQAAMAQARDSGKAALSGKVELVQETGQAVQAGTLMYVPVYRKGMPLDTVEQRRAALSGWSYSPFRMNDLMNSALAEWQGQLGRDLHLTLYDGGEFSAESVLYSTWPNRVADSDSPFHQHRTIDFNGHSWLLAMDRGPGSSGISYLPAWLTLAGGLVISVLLSRLVSSLAGVTRKAERMAQQLSADILQKDRLIRESEFRWKYALEGSNLGTWDWSIPDNKVYFSSNWKAMLGYVDHEVGDRLGEWSDRVHPDDLPSVTAAVKDYLEGRSQAYDNEYRVRCKDGSYKWIHDRGTIVSRDRDGKPLRMIGTHSDVTERSLLLATLRERQADLEEAQRIARTGSWQLDLATGHVTWSVELYRMTGLDPDQPVPDYARQECMFVPESWTRLDTAVGLVRSKGTPYELELEMIRPDGSHGWMLARGEAVRGDGGAITAIRGVAIDITERKRAELAMHSSQELLRGIVENIPIRVFWKDRELRYLGCNSAFAGDAGLRHPEEIVGKDDFQLSWREHAELYRADDRQIIESGTPKLDYEEPLTLSDGRTIRLRTSKVPLRNENGSIFGMLGIYEDITGQKQAASSIRLLGSLYAALSECNAAVIHCTDEAELFRRICEVVVDRDDIAMAWIGITDAGGRVIPVASHGLGKEYTAGIHITVHADDPHGQGPTGTAVRENRAIWVDDFRTSHFTTPWQHRGSPYGWLSSAALPVCRGGKPVGALTIYSRTSGGWRNEQTRDLLGKMAEAVSLALDHFDSAAAIRDYQSTLLESEQRFRTMVEQSIAGSFIIQDNRVVYANPRLAEILGHADGSTLVGHPPGEFVIPRDTEKIEAGLRTFIAGNERSTSMSFTALRRDGSTVEVGASVAKAVYQQGHALIGLVQDISDKKVAEERIRRYASQLEHAFMQIVSLATTLSEMRDAYTAGHEKRVAEIAVAIGREMGLPEDRVEGLRVGGYLHDVGKVSIPTEILSKPGRLTELELALVKTHAKAGHEVLKDIEFPWPVAQIALQHHERIDGSGYPAGLKGGQIILEARIIAVADVVESMASHRPYRAALGLDKALAEIEHGSGTIYDAGAAQACLRLFREKGLVLPD